VNRRFNSNNVQYFKPGDRAWVLLGRNNDQDETVKATVLKRDSAGCFVRFDTPITLDNQTYPESSVDWTCLEPLNALERVAEV
jgi:hypothetical protein